MSYSSLGAVGPDCAKVQAMMPGLNTYMPGDICPSSVSKSGDDPPKPTWCGGVYTYAIQQGLINAGIISGPVTKIPTQQFIAAVKSIAAKYGLLWNGDLWNVSPDLCRALATEISATAPNCPGDWPTHPCVVPIQNKARPGGNVYTPPAPPPPAPPPAPARTLARFVARPSIVYTGAAPAPATRVTVAPVRRITAPMPTPAAPPAPAPSPGRSMGPGAQMTPTDQPGAEPEGQPVTNGAAAADAEGIPVWVYAAGGAALLGVVAILALK